MYNNNHTSAMHILIWKKKNSKNNINDWDIDSIHLKSIWMYKCEKCVFYYNKPKIYA